MVAREKQVKEQPNKIIYCVKYAKNAQWFIIGNSNKCFRKPVDNSGVEQIGTALTNDEHKL